MLVISKLEEPYLHLDAYSHSQSELEDISTTLLSANVEFTSENLPRDQEQRRGRKFKIYDSSVKKLEDLLGIRFAKIDNSTKLQFTDETSGQSYRCEDLNGSDCQSLKASSDGAARIICGAIAREKGWRGGISKPGNC